MTLTVERLREVLHYDSETGVFVWTVIRTRNPTVRKVAGSIHQGRHITIRVDRRAYLAHRLAWLYVRGEWPTQHIDHIDGNGFNNRIANLRDVSRYINLQNRKKANINSSAGLIGVVPSRKAWCAQIKVNGKSTHLGTYKTVEEAHTAYITAKRQLHPGNTL